MAPKMAGENFWGDLKLRLEAFYPKRTGPRVPRCSDQLFGQKLVFPKNC